VCVCVSVCVSVYLHRQLWTCLLTCKCLSVFLLACLFESGCLCLCAHSKEAVCMPCNRVFALCLSWQAKLYMDVQFCCMRCNTTVRKSKCCVDLMLLHAMLMCVTASHQHCAASIHRHDRHDMLFSRCCLAPTTRESALPCSSKQPTDSAQSLCNSSMQAFRATCQDLTSCDG